MHSYRSGFGFLGLLVTISIIGFMLLFVAEYLESPFSPRSANPQRTSPGGDPVILDEETGTDTNSDSGTLGPRAIERSRELRDDLNERDETYNKYLE